MQQQQQQPGLTDLAERAGGGDGKGSTTTSGNRRPSSAPLQMCLSRVGAGAGGKAQGGEVRSSGEVIAIVCFDRYVV